MAKRKRRAFSCLATDMWLLPRCYQHTRHQDDLGRHAASLDRFRLVGLGLLGCPEYVVRGNS